MERNDSKSTTTTGFPVHGQIARIDLVSGVRSRTFARSGGLVLTEGGAHLDQVGIEGIRGYSKIIVTLFLLLLE